MRAFVDSWGTKPDLLEELHHSAGFIKSFPDWWLGPGCQGRSRAISRISYAARRFAQGASFTIEGDPDFEETYSIPEDVRHLVDTVAYGMSSRWATDVPSPWGLRFASSVPVGADLSSFTDSLIIELLRDERSPFTMGSDSRWEAVAALFDRRLAGDVRPEEEWLAASSARSMDPTSHLFVRMAGVLGGRPGPHAPGDIANLLSGSMDFLGRAGGDQLRVEALWDRIGEVCIDVAEACRPPPPDAGEPEAFVLSSLRPGGGVPLIADLVCAGTAAHCAQVVADFQDMDWRFVEGREVLETLGVVAPPDKPEDALPSPSP